MTEPQQTPISKTPKGHGTVSIRLVYADGFESTKVTRVIPLMEVADFLAKEAADIMQTLRDHPELK